MYGAGLAPPCAPWVKWVFPSHSVFLLLWEVMLLRSSPSSCSDTHSFSRFFFFKLHLRYPGVPRPPMQLTELTGCLTIAEWLCLVGLRLFAHKKFYVSSKYQIYNYFDSNSVEYTGRICVTAHVSTVLHFSIAERPVSWTHVALVPVGLLPYM